MSLVGPRPFTPEQRNLYDAGALAPAYYDLVPGISGLWQISRRNAGTFGERVDFDEAYGRRISLKTDAWILWRTFGVVVRATGL
jgi:lipopolysaccharide/colanic/teichoic acid biosynthesis glycosyltransferase